MRFIFGCFVAHLERVGMYWRGPPANTCVIAILLRENHGSKSPESELKMYPHNDRKTPVTVEWNSLICTSPKYFRSYEASLKMRTPGTKMQLKCDHRRPRWAKTAKNVTWCTVNMYFSLRGEGRLQRSLRAVGRRKEGSRLRPTTRTQ